MIRILFVCSGNICRSPMAEGVFQHLVDQAGLTDQILVDSAGTGAWHVGERAHRGTRQVLADHGIDYRGRSRMIERADFFNHDYILVMDDDNLADVQSMIRRSGTDAQISLLMDYAPDAGVREVPDPYYSGRFEEVYDLIRQAAENLLAAVRQEHGL